MTEDPRHRKQANQKPTRPTKAAKPGKAERHTTAAPPPGAARKPSSKAAAHFATAGDWVAVGTIVGTFGIRGDLKVQPLTDFPERFARTPTLYLGDDHTPHAVESAREHGRIVVVHLGGIDTATAAEKLRGARLYVPATEVVALPADQYYLHDLIGLHVEHIDGTPLGVIADVITAGGNDLFVVRQPQARGEVLLPAVKEFVKSVDVASGVVRVAPIPGLFDDNAEIADQPGIAVDEAVEADESDNAGTLDQPDDTLRA